MAELLGLVIEREGSRYTGVIATVTLALYDENSKDTGLRIRHIVRYNDRRASVAAAKIGAKWTVTIEPGAPGE